MKKKKIIAIVTMVAIMLIMPLIPLVVSAGSNIEVIDWEGDGYWSHDTWYIDLYPGEEATIELEIESSEDEAIVVYVDYDMPKDLQIYFNHPAFEIERNDSEWIEITVYAPGDIEPKRYEIDFYFKTIEPITIVEIVTETEIEIVTETKYVDKIQYVDREVSKIVYVKEGIDWWWLPIGIMLAILITLLLDELVRRKMPDKKWKQSEKE